MAHTVSRFILSCLAVTAACGGSNSTSPDAGSSTCTLTDNTTATSTVTGGCALLTRDASSCKAARVAAGLSGAWLKFSCRVSLSVSSTNVVAVSDSQPDYKSNYFATTNACYTAYTPVTNFPDPSLISAWALSMKIPMTPGGTSQAMSGMYGGVEGMALNGVELLDNHAGGTDDIYNEVTTFDQCQGHPNRGGYHYHTEPYSISYNDSNLVGVMRDGSFLYGRLDADGSTPTLDSYGGHTGTTADSTTAVYHYHINKQTSTTAGTAGQTAYFLTTGTFAHTPGSCTGCTGG